MGTVTSRLVRARKALLKNMGHEDGKSALETLG
jgi:DNA-directed RNA polymerase specialized sigma24 family protein